MAEVTPSTKCNVTDPECAVVRGRRSANWTACRSLRAVRRGNDCVGQQPSPLQLRSLEFKIKSKGRFVQRFKRYDPDPRFDPRFHLSYQVVSTACMCAHERKHCMSLPKLTNLLAKYCTTCSRLADQTVSTPTTTVLDLCMRVRVTSTIFVCIDERRFQSQQFLQTGVSRDQHRVSDNSQQPRICFSPRHQTQHHSLKQIFVGQ